MVAESRGVFCVVDGVVDGVVDAVVDGVLMVRSRFSEDPSIGFLGE